MIRVCYVSRTANDADVDTVGEQILLVRGSSRKNTAACWVARAIATMHARERRKREALSEDSRRVAHEMADGREEPKSAVAVDEALLAAQKRTTGNEAMLPEKNGRRARKKSKGREERSLLEHGLLGEE